MTTSNWITVVGFVIAGVVQLVMFAYAYGRFTGKFDAITGAVDRLEKIVTNGLSDKVAKMHTRVAVIATRMGIEEDE